MLHVTSTASSLRAYGLVTIIGTMLTEQDTCDTLIVMFALYVGVDRYVCRHREVDSRKKKKCFSSLTCAWYAHARAYTLPDALG